MFIVLVQKSKFYTYIPNFKSLRACLVYYKVNVIFRYPAKFLNTPTLYRLMKIMDVLLMKRVCPPGRQAMLCFSSSCIIFLTCFFSGVLLGYSSELFALNFWGPGLYFCLLNFILRYCYQGFMYEVSVRSAFLGAAFATGAYLVTFDSGLKVFGLYAMCLSLFHFSEFMAVAVSNPSTLSIDSFILNHSLQYGLAAVASWTEFAVEYYLFPSMKTFYILSFMGFLMCSGGDILRKAAMLTAKTNFNHVVQYVKRPDHELVTHGVYSVCRHPSYVGWFYWSIGTQLTLLNPVCTVAYTLASWFFFRERVFAEELTLISFFGHQYLQYQTRVPTGLPFIRGHALDVDPHTGKDERNS